MGKISNKENDESTGVSSRKKARLSTSKSNIYDNQVESIINIPILGLSTNSNNNIQAEAGNHKDSTVTSKLTNTEVFDIDQQSEKLNALKIQIKCYYEPLKDVINLRSKKIQDRIKSADSDKKKSNSVIEYKNLIIRLNKKFCKEIDNIIEENIEQIEKLKSDESKVFKITDLNKTGFYFDNKHMKSSLMTKYPLGALIIANWSLSKNDLRCLYAFFSPSDESVDIMTNYLSEKDCFRLDSDAMNIFKDMFIDHRLNENDNIIRLDKQELIKDLKRRKELNIFCEGQPFSNYQIKQICENVFENMSQNLERLSISNKIHRNILIHKNSFRGLTNLKELTLCLNKNYEQFDSSIINFEFMPNLEKLSLTNLRTKFLDLDCLSSSSKLKNFELSESDVKRMNTDFFHKIGPQLESLSLGKFHLVVGYKDLFKEMSNIKSLNFISTNINIKSKKEECFDLEKELLNYMPKLSKLELDWENFKIIYDKLSQIDDLNLYFNDIYSDNESELIEVICELNEKYFTKMINLKAIRFEFDNSYGDLALVFKKSLFHSFQKQYKQIETIEMSNALQCEVHPNVFSSFTNLKVLKMNGFELEHLVNGVFNGLHNLEDLNLQGNSIKKIDSKVFYYLKSLKILNLSDNEISECSLRPILFKNIAKNLETLDLKGNCIRIIDLQMFKTIFGFNDTIEIIRDVNFHDVDVKNMCMQKIFDNDLHYCQKDEHNLSTIDCYLASSSDESDAESNTESMSFDGFYNDSNESGCSDESGVSNESGCT